MARDVTAERERALDAALVLYTGPAFAALVNAPDGPNAATAAVRRTAETLFRWLIGGVSFTITHGVVRDQTTGQPTGNTTGGTHMQLRDNEEVDLTIDVESAKGNPIADDPSTEADNLVWTVDGADGLVTLDVSDDTRTATVRAGSGLGSAVVTVELSGSDQSATVAVDVIAGAAARIVINEGTPRPQQPATEEPTPEG
jgi:hypothetical protein